MSNGSSHYGGGYGVKVGGGHRPKQPNSIAGSSDSWRTPAFGNSKWQEPSWRSQNRSNWKNDSWRSNKSHDSSWSAQDDLAESMQNVSLDSHQQSFGTGGGIRGSIPFGPSSATYRYSTDELAKIYRKLLYTGRLLLPSVVSRDDPMLFTTAGEFVDVVEQLQGMARRPVNAYISMGHSSEAPKSSISPVNSLPHVLPGEAIIPTSPPTEQYLEEPHLQPQPTQLVDDMYMYVDPQGMWQGPFRRAEILEWHAAGFFPPDLVMKSSSDTSGRLTTLQDLLMTWSGGMYVTNAPTPYVQDHVFEPQHKHTVIQEPGGIYIADHVVQKDEGQETFESPLAPHNTAVDPFESPQEVEEHVEDARMRPETKPAPWLASRTSDAMISLKDIQQEEDERRSKLQTEAKIEAQKTSMQKSGWASVAKSTDSYSLKDIQNEELQSKQEAQNAFWDYEEKNTPVRTPTAVESSTSVWIAAAAAGTRQEDANRGVPTISKPAPVMQPKPSPPPPPPRPSHPEVVFQSPAAPALQLAEADPTDQGRPLAGEFRTWCAGQMKALTGSDDVTLCEFLMTVESNSEVADYIGAYLGTTPAVATFSAEYIKRKLVELATGKKSRKARAKAKARAASTAETSKATTDLHQNQPDDSSWETVETTRRRNKSDVSARESAKSFSSGFAVLGGH